MRTIKAILFDLDGTLLDTEALSDKAVLVALGSWLPPQVLQESPMKEFRLPWDLKKQILGLRGSEWIPLVLQYAEKHWGVTDESCPPSP
jgi:beta-phosphoglucomutase-like phosphatase (HAD superfamily)